MLNSIKKIKCLFISSYVFYDPISQVHGVYKRMRLLIDSICRSVDEIKFLFFVDETFDIYNQSKSIMEALKSICIGVNIDVCFCHIQNESINSGLISQYLLPSLNVFKQPSFRRYTGIEQAKLITNELAQQPDIIVAHRFSSMIPLLQKRDFNIKKILFDMDDIEHVAFLRSMVIPPLWASKRLFYAQLPALMLGESKAIKLAQKTLVCSELDKHKLAWLGPIDKIEVVPNAVDFPTITISPLGKNLLFLGSFTYKPNVQAAEFLLEEIWPRIHNKIPDTRLTIGGIHQEAILHFNTPPHGVTFAGFIENLENTYAASTVVVCPILSGGGTRVKIIEAAAHGKAIVSTTIGAEGLSFVNGESILLRDNPDDFALACVELIESPSQAVSIGLKARRDALRHYERNVVLQNIISLIQQILDS